MTIPEAKKVILRSQGLFSGMRSGKTILYKALNVAISAFDALTPHILTAEEVKTGDMNLPVWIERHDPGFAIRLTGVMDLYTAIQYGTFGYGKHIRFWAGARPSVELMDETKWAEEPSK